MGHSLIITETASTIASQTLMGMILPQTSLKHKNHNEPNNKKEKINTQTHAHENFSQVKETKEIFEDSQVGNNPKSFVLKLLWRVC
ncbi:hypothetical protein HpMMM16_01770 [Helicobacter pylori]